MRLSRSRVPVVVGILAVAAATVAVVPSSAHAAPAAPAASAERASASGRAVAVLPSIIPTWAKTAKVLGATPDNQQVFVSLALAGKDPAGEAAYATAATTPGNPLYRHWLTVDQFQARFGSIDGEAAAVTAALKVLGVTNVMTDKLGQSLLMAIPASTASTLFGVHFEQVMHGGQSTRVATNELTLPASLLPYVVDVSGLTQERVHTDHTTMEKVSPPIDPALPASGAPPAYFNASPTSTYYGSNLATDKPTYPILSGDTSTTKPYNTSGYTPPQLRGAYGVDQVAETGAGVTAGVVLFYDGPDVGSDLQTFSTAYGLAAPSYTDLSVENEGVTIAGGSAPVLDPVDAEGEQTLDVEAIHQMAPGASIVYSGAVAPEDGPIYVAEDTAIVGGAEVINNSFGGSGDTDSADAEMFADEVTEPAMTLGVGIDFSSGDAADNVAANGEREGDFPATSDEVTAVGGTGLEVGPTNNYEGEFYWGTYSSPALGSATTWGPIASQAGGAGGGGGVSTYYAEPTWQKGVVPDEETFDKDDATSADSATGTGVTTPGRVLPDVAMLADSTTGILIGETQVSDYTTSATVPNEIPAYSYYRIGGTSVSSPLFTGMMALVDQALTEQAGTATSAGFANPTMYPFDTEGDGAFRDPQIGRSPTGERLGSSAAQVLTGCDSSGECTGAGPGVVPVVAEVRADFTDTANDGQYTGSTDPVTGAVPTGATAGNPVIFHLRAEGILGTLEDLPGYDDSTGLGSPDAPQFIAAWLASGAGVTRPSLPIALPDASIPVVFLVIGAVVGTAVVTRRRRRGGLAV